MRGRQTDFINFAVKFDISHSKFLMKNDVYGLFNDSFPPVLDGVSLTVQNYAKWLINKGKRVCVVTPWNPFDPKHPDFEMHRYFSLPIYNRYPYRYGYPLVDPFIWRNCRRVPFRLVHAHCPFSSGRLARYAARYHKIPLIATFHSKFRTDLERSLPGFMVDYQMKRMRRFFNEADALWIPQAAVEETVREYGITAPVTVVDNGNDLGDDTIDDIAAVKSDARRRLGIADNRIMLIFVGQHIREKGVLIIIDALSKLAGIDFEMHFVGNGYASAEMKRRAEALNLSDRICFHGVVNERSHLRDLYAAADLFLFPSLYDNAPLVVREAAMMGTPTLLPEGSTAAEVVTDGVNGFMTSPSAEAYARRIAELATDRETIARVGVGARDTLARTWSNVMDEVASRYEEIIKRFDYEHRNR